MKPFKRRRRGGLYAEFEVYEAEMLANFAAQLVELLSDRSGTEEIAPDPLFASVDLEGPRTIPDDPVLARLFPDAYGDDPESSADFRRYTERDLSAKKVDNARRVLDSLAAAGLVLDGSEQTSSTIEVELDQAAVQAWLRWLTDVRLSVAVRLGLDDGDPDAVDDLADDPGGIDPDDEGYSIMLDIYDWLGFVQETLVVALDQ